jgi:peptide/nickel transport system permease protein
MTRFIFKRLLLSLPLLLGITFLSFFIIQLAPGDFLDSLRLDPQTSPEIIRFYEEKFQLDKPFIVQYMAWLGNVVRGEFGYSFAYKAKVSDVVISRLFNTFILSLASLLVTWIFVIPLGVIAALKRNRFIDRLLSGVCYLGISMPGFFLAFLLLYLASYSNLLPLGGMRSINHSELSAFGKIADIAKHLIIPTIVLSFGSVCALQRTLRANLFDALGSSYIKGAKARGLSNMRIVYIHALKNAINPMITIFGYQLSGLLSGAALIEIILGYPGLGVVMLEAVLGQDLYLIMGALLMSGVLLIAGNLIADILLGIFDPRIRYERAR